MSKEIALELPTNLTVDRLPEATVNAIKRIPKELWQLPADELELRAKPSYTDYRMRKSLWEEIGRHEGPINITRICLSSGIDKRYYFHMIENPAKLAFLFSPAYNYTSELETVIEISMGKLKKALQANIVDEDNNIKVGAAKIVMEIYKLASDRVYGQAVQKMETFNHNSPKSDPKNLTMEEIKARIATLEKAKDIIDIDALPAEGPFAITTNNEAKHNRHGLT